METGSGCFLSFSALTQQIPQWKLKGSIQIRCVRQKRSIKLNIKLPVSIHEARNGQRFSLLKFLTRKHNVSQAKE